MPRASTAAPPLDASSPVRGATPLDSRAIGSELVAALLRQTDRTAALSELSDFARRLTNGLFAVYQARGEHDRLFAAAQSSACGEQSLPPDLLERLTVWGELACESGQARLDPLAGDLTLITVPIERREALSVALLLNGARVEPFLLAVQLLAALTPFVDRSLSQRETAWEAQATAAILDLTLRLAAARDVKSACRMLVEQLPSCLVGRRVAVGVLQNATGRCRLMALTGLGDFDSRAELPRAVERVLQRSSAQTSTLMFPCDAPIEDVTKLVEVSKCASLLAAPLRTPEGRTIGAWLFLSDAAEAGNASQQRFIVAAGEAVAAVLAALQQKPWRLWPSSSASWNAGRGWVKPAIVLAALAAAGAMGIPFPYEITCECQLQPATRRFVAAPFAGVLEKSLASPGDLVRRDDILGLMDGKEIRWELASVSAEQQRVSKAHDVNLAAGKVAAAQIDRLEMERLAQKRQLLEHRSANLQIKSPIDGILLSGDLKRSEGVPLTVGQRLYEVAPLEQMIVELSIPDEEVSLVEAGQAVSVRLDAAGELPAGRLDRVHPRSELRDNENVFLGEVTLPNEDSLLRPGMKGRARIVAAPQRLGWILFHSAWNKLINWIGW